MIELMIELFLSFFLSFLNSKGLLSAMSLVALRPNLLDRVFRENLSLTSDGRVRFLPPVPNFTHPY
jgi:hypothetical protein